MVFCIRLYLRIFAYTCTTMSVTRCITWRIWCTLRSLQATPIFDQVVDPETGKVTFIAPGGLEFSRVAWSFPMFSQMFGEFLHFSPLLGGASPFFPNFLEAVSPFVFPIFGGVSQFVSSFLGEFLIFFTIFWWVSPVFPIFLGRLSSFPIFVWEKHSLERAMMTAMMTWDFHFYGYLEGLNRNPACLGLANIGKTHISVFFF